MPFAHSLSRNITLPSGTTYKLPMASHRGAVRPNQQRMAVHRPHKAVAVGSYTYGTARTTHALGK